MPVHLRRFCYQKLVDAKKAEKEEMDKAKSKNTARPPRRR
tara:strand:+ start:964 stop:1083 length:120 start_codon:yes stop_codon:yes gene_type:complete